MRKSVDDTSTTSVTTFCFLLSGGVEPLDMMTMIQMTVDADAPNAPLFLIRGVLGPAQMKPAALDL
jgi:hypothetical protein